MSTVPTRAPFVLIDAAAAFVPSGGIGRYVRDLAHALEHIEGAPRSRLLVTRNRLDAARARFPSAEIVPLPFSWRELALAVMAGTTLGVPFDGLYREPALVHSPLGYGPVFRRAKLINHIHDLTC